MKNKNILFTLVLLPTSHIFAHYPMEFVDKNMVRQAETIIARHKQHDPAVQHAIVNGVEEYSCTDKTGIYRVQVDPKKETVSIQLGSNRRNNPFIVFDTNEDQKIAQAGGTATIKHFSGDETVTKMWRTKSGEEKLWSSVTLSAALYALFAEKRPAIFYGLSVSLMRGTVEPKSANSIVVELPDISQFDEPTSVSRNLNGDKEYKGVIFHTTYKGVGKPCVVSGHGEKLATSARVQAEQKKQSQKEESKSQKK